MRVLCQIFTCGLNCLTISGPLFVSLLITALRFFWQLPNLSTLFSKWDISVQTGFWKWNFPIIRGGASIFLLPSLMTLCLHLQITLAFSDSIWFQCHLIDWAPSCYTVLWQYHFLHFILLLDCLQAKCASLLFLQMESHCVMFSSYLKWHLMETVISCSQHFSRLPPCIRVSFPKPRRNSFQVYIYFLSFLYVGEKWCHVL